LGLALIEVTIQQVLDAQAPLIEPHNPRTVFFNDSVAVAWMNGGFIELVGCATWIWNTDFCAIHAAT
jgi:hypothetical protein